MRTVRSHSNERNLSSSNEDTPRIKKLRKKPKDKRRRTSHPKESDSSSDDEKLKPGSHISNPRNGGE